mmetsp:Transcript_105896/g.298327  ORF Transcript_105896/g.298327 Transcript_105896/m.298327 type:complete len:274 (+) Transcript_105896:183-1004(+)
MTVALRMPFQLFPGDRYNVALGVLLLFALAGLKDFERLPSVVRWQMNAYTNWSLALLTLGIATGQKQWEPFLCANSIGLLVGYRTAMAQGLDGNLIKKFKSHGVIFSKPLFGLLDHLLHTVPAVALVAWLVSNKTRVPYINAMYCAIMSSWFAFRQQAKLDSSGIYVPHPWVRSWLGIWIGSVLTTPLIDSLIRRQWSRSALVMIGLTLPWCTTRFDPGLKKKYMFEYAVACVGSPQQVPRLPSVTCRDPEKGRSGMPHVRSDIISASAKLEL